MSFRVISNTHPRDKDLPDPDRTFALSLRLSLLNGTFYDNLSYEFHEAWIGSDYVYMIDRKPNVPTGTAEIQVQMARHAALLFGEFPQIETQDVEARSVLNDWAAEVELEEQFRHSAYVGSVGSVAYHVRALEGRDGKTRVYIRARTTEYLTPEFDPAQPDVLIRITEQYKIRGHHVRRMGYSIPDDDLQEIFWFMREWDEYSEIWYIPWKVSLERQLLAQGQTYTPVRDDNRSIDHNLKFCPWVWAKTPGADAESVDGPCAFERGIEHAIQLDYEDSQIVAGIKYAMSPTMVLKQPAAAPGMTSTTNSGSGFVKTPETLIIIDAQADMFSLDMDARGFTEAREKAKELRTNLIEFVHGDRVDPKEITQGHQGSKTMAMINDPMLNYVKVLQKVYGAALLRVLHMFLRIAATKPVYVNDERVRANPGKLKDLSLRWHEFYEMTAEEKSATALAIKTLIENGTLSRETAVNDLANTWGIQDVPAELARIEADKKADDARAVALAQATAQVKVSDTID